MLSPTLAVVTPANKGHVTISSGFCMEWHLPVQTEVKNIAKTVE